MQILIVEDEKRLAQALKQILERQKYMADIVYNGNDGVDYGSNSIYDLIILDVMLPGKDGYEVASQLRKKNIHTPILMLTAKDSIPDKISGLDSGADDYMTKPFAPEELLARVRALSRRQGEVLMDKLQFSDIVLNCSTSVLKSKDKEVTLNFKEAEILKLLLSHPSFILSKEEIINKVWGYDSDAGDSNVEAYMSFLRRKLFFVGSKVHITAIKKQGYRLEDQVC